MHLPQTRSNLRCLQHLRESFWNGKCGVKRSNRSQSFRWAPSISRPHGQCNTGPQPGVRKPVNCTPRNLRSIFRCQVQKQATIFLSKPQKLSAGCGPGVTRAYGLYHSWHSSLHFSSVIFRKNRIHADISTQTTWSKHFPIRQWSWVSEFKTSVALFFKLSFC